jgi:hypothetical protein
VWNKPLDYGDSLDTLDCPGFIVQVACCSNDCSNISKAHGTRPFIGIRLAAISGKQQGAVEGRLNEVSILSGEVLNTELA